MFNTTRIQEVYGAGKGNWVDRPVFQGNFVNFGLWHGIPLNHTLTVQERIKSSYGLYEYVVDKLSITQNDTLLEIGCGTGKGMFTMLEQNSDFIRLNNITLIDITKAQIDRTNQNKLVAKHTNLGKMYYFSGKCELFQDSLDALSHILDIKYTYDLQLRLANAQLHALKSEMNSYESNSEENRKKNTDASWATLLTEEIQEYEDRKINLKKNIERLNEDFPSIETEISIYREKIKEFTQHQEKAKKIYKKITENIAIKQASAYDTGLPGQSVDKVFSIEAFQHIEKFDELAKEVHRILTLSGIMCFCAHFTTSEDASNQLIKSDLLGESSIIFPIVTVIESFENLGFHVSSHSIGEYVFPGFEKWTQENTDEISAKLSHNVYKSYTRGWLDYFVVCANKNPEQCNANEQEKNLTEDQMQLVGVDISAHTDL